VTGPSLGVLLFLPYRHLEERVLDAVRAAGYSVTTAQARVFQRVDPQGSRLTRLAAAAQVTKQTAGYLVDQLERGGYLERIPDPSDARARLIRITALGLEAAAVARQEEARVEAEWVSLLGNKRAEELRQTLLALRSITDTYATD
jgi:DNA-binding MarR family transcriptional regulator